MNNQPPFKRTECTKERKPKKAIIFSLVVLAGISGAFIYNQSNTQKSTKNEQATSSTSKSKTTNSSKVTESKTDASSSVATSLKEEVDTTKLTTDQVGEWVIASYTNLKGLEVSPTNFHVTVKAHDDGLVYATLYGWSLTNGEEVEYRITADGILEMFGLAEHKWITAETSYRGIGYYPNGIDLAKVLDGDFSTLYGTWVASDGSYFTINSDNTVTFNQTSSTDITTLTVSDLSTKLNSSIPYLGLQVNRPTAGAGLFFLYPKGVTSHLGDSSDTTKDRIQAGFQTTSLTNDNVYYRQE